MTVQWECITWVTWFLCCSDAILHLDQHDILSARCCSDDVLLGKIRLAVKNSFQGTESLAGGKNSFQVLKKYIFHWSGGKDDMVRSQKAWGPSEPWWKKNIFQYRQLREKWGPNQWSQCLPILQEPIMYNCRIVQLGGFFCNFHNYVLETAEDRKIIWVGVSRE